MTKVYQMFMSKISMIFLRRDKKYLEIFRYTNIRSNRKQYNL